MVDTSTVLLRDCCLDVDMRLLDYYVKDECFEFRSRNEKGRLKYIIIPRAGSSK
jgi:hypothetical protein